MKSGIWAAGLVLFSPTLWGYPDLSGLWALCEVTVERWEVPFMGERERIGETFSLVEIVHNGPDLEIVIVRPCGVLVDSGTSLVRVTIPEAFWRLRAGERVRGRLVQEGSHWIVEVPRFPEVYGVRLDDPYRDPLPTSPEDPRIVDHDGDGKPGVTVLVTVALLLSGEVYTVQRFWREYRGVLENPGFIRGTLFWENEEFLVGASSSLFLQSGKGVPDYARSFFVLLRIDEPWDCARVMEVLSQRGR